MPALCKPGPLPKFPCEKKEGAAFSLSFVRVISSRDVRVFGGEGRKTENFPFEGQMRALAFSSPGSRLSVC